MSMYDHMHPVGGEAAADRSAQRAGAARYQSAPHGMSEAGAGSTIAARPVSKSVPSLDRSRKP